MTLRHLTGSAEVITLVNRFGHCASYSRVIELEKAMCKAIDERQGVIPSTISPNRILVTHLCLDNLDLTEETPSGASTTHTAHGIIIQEVSTAKENISESPEEFDQARTKSQSAKCTSQNIEPCYAKNKVEPHITVSKTEAACTLDEPGLNHLTLWFLCRSGVLRHTAQVVPPGARWVWLTETSKNSSVQQSAVDHMAPVFAPVTENAIVQQILKLSRQASREVHPQYMVVTFDLAVAKKAYSLVWQSPGEFSDVIVHMGSFHLTGAFMGALGKKMRCSGLEEVLIESGICASGSIEQVLTGKHYNRALRVHKVVYEALERILLQVYESLHCCLFDEQGVTTLDHLAKNPCKDNLLACLASESCNKSLDRYDEFKETVRQGVLDKTAQYWLSYMEKVGLILQFQPATKENCLTLHLASLQRMCSLFFIFDHPNYARYSAFYLLNMLDLEKTYPGAEDLLKNNGFSVNRSDVHHLEMPLT
ncbi:unnamed protein product [Porites evermanni]|uniref:Uncharacterized protein n=1 Tax=Porites evermanni TaxID=104178 RepID=A0ABN8LYB7_9CNID|nr:unnamed protein product [Porites evermanni]